MLVLALVLMAGTAATAFAPGSDAAGTQLVVNPGLEQGGTPPTCFQSTSSGTNRATSGVSTADRHGGARAWRISMTARTSGDRKLLVSGAAGCAPAVTAGRRYNLSVWYRSTSAANAISLYRYTSAGWSYWMDAKALPQVSAWTRASVTTAAVPAGTTRLAFGVSIAAVGVLLTDDYSMALSAATDPAASQGRWTTLSYTLATRTIHTTLLRNGKVLLIAGSGNDQTQFDAGSFTAQVWDPVAGTFTSLVVPKDMFCSGHVTLADGRVLIMGGTAAFPNATTGTGFTGLADSYIFDPATNRFTKINDAQTGHWYPTLTKLGNGDVWSAGGLNQTGSGSTNTELYSAAQGRWLSQNEVTQTWSYWGTYPHMILLQDGRLFYSGAHTFGQNTPGTGASLYDINGGVIQDVPGLRDPGTRDQAGSTLLPPAQDQKVAIFGGGDTINNGTGIALTDVIDLSAASPAYHAAPDMPGLGKGYVNTIVLPDRTVLTTGGAQHNRTDPVLTSALFNPVTETWTSVADDPVPRAYHSTAVLLPDGRVVTMGGNPADGSFEMRISIYEPPYLFKGTRPTITGAPATATYGQQFPIGVTTTGTVAHVDLTAPMSVTHQTDPNMRLVDVPFVQNTDGTLTLALPTNPNLLPPGPYMLTLTNSNGVPSVASWITVGS